MSTPNAEKPRKAREERTMKRLKAIIVILASLAAVVLAHHYLKRPEPGQKSRTAGETPVAVEKIGTRHFADRIQGIGTVSANESVTITSTVSELVTEVLFQDGALVKQGDVLVRLKSAEQSAQLEEARISLAEQTRQFDRVKALREKDMVAEQEFDTAQSNLDAANARFQAAQARLKDRVITAPFEGVLGIRRVSPGTLVSPGSVITTLDDLGVVKVDFTVPETLLAELAVGQSIEARGAAWPDERFQGKVASIDSRVDPTTRAVTVQARVPNPDRRLRTGMLLTVELASRPRDAVAVPEKALLAYADKQYVFVLQDDQTVAQRGVKLGEREAGWVEVEDGLKEGDTIVVDGIMDLRDGAHVRVSDSAGGAVEQTTPPPPQPK
jgi:membrane fusion protein (multidrug efflux system)